MICAVKLMFAAALFGTTLAAGSDDDVVQRVHAHVVGYDVVASACRNVFADVAEPGSATFDFHYQIMGRGQPGSYSGKVTFALGDVAIHIPRSIGWAGMTAGDRERTDALRRAIYHHEVGHVRIAEAVRDVLNASSTIEAPNRAAFAASAAAAGRDGFALFRREEREYDALTDHGRRQHAAPGDLAGSDTLLLCQ